MDLTPMRAKKGTAKKDAGIAETNDLAVNAMIMFPFFMEKEVVIVSPILSIGGVRMKERTRNRRISIVS